MPPGIKLGDFDKPNFRDVTLPVYDEAIQRGEQFGELISRVRKLLAAQPHKLIGRHDFLRHVFQSVMEKAGGWPP